MKGIIRSEEKVERDTEMRNREQRTSSGESRGKQLLWRSVALVLISLALFLQLGVKGSAAVKDPRPDYAILVNKAMNCVTIYIPDGKGAYAPVKSMVCSVGREGHGTPEGQFKTSNYYDWRLMKDGTYGRYAVRFNKHILFHSVPYYSQSPDQLEWDQYNLLGEAASLGCVRLSVADAKWIYDNCKVGTPVLVYSNDKVAGPLGKPTAIRIDPESPNRGWDPTDIDANNPWRVQ